ncbi:hypothetical protein ACWT_8057 [Actinoplanes sp. SE50]|uniref:hypothetical protein n=1 Tax=unclassified Actinoplanes TaxID=2626549 RepID=UPI00023EDCB4|nr:MULTISPECIES: hypothetical protein [unclassified Actinoplanes]AEV89066.1 hypothetical protein ACPL_8188 [Actinoplanes sp. SE50/110]ATO87472.1 hypothetical protein ACWT_8057 [Actinoplanes sp. SE50]SLM04890.1 uncharacterized protein ACSP50_8202 [Actinoplanes sp. SE50/110]
MPRASSPLTAGSPARRRLMPSLGAAGLSSRWLMLYLRSRRAPLALALVGAGTVLLWILWVTTSKTRDVDCRMVQVAVLLAVAALTATLGAPDDALERTGAVNWPLRRTVHLLVALLIVVGLLTVTLLTPARFGPASFVLRDAAGLLGLTALGAASIGPARSWFAPLGWTLTAVMFPLGDGTIQQIVTWQAQPSGNAPATVTALLLALGGLVAYANAGPSRRAPAEVPV